MTEGSGASAGYRRSREGGSRISRNIIVDSFQCSRDMQVKSQIPFQDWTVHVCDSLQTELSGALAHMRVTSIKAVSTRKLSGNCLYKADMSRVGKAPSPRNIRRPSGDGQAVAKPSLK